MKVHQFLTSRRLPVGRPLLLVAGAAAVLLLAACSSDAEAQTADKGPSRSVTATATGTATGVPDQRSASVGISNEGSSAAAVLTESNVKTQALLDELKKAGIDAKDVATTSVDLGPRFDAKGKIIGYQANNMLRVTLRDLATAGAKLDTLVQSGGDNARVQGISLGFNDDDALLSEARADAVKRAKAQATEMAEAGDAKVGPVRTIADVATRSFGYAEGAARAMDDTSVPIAAGTQELTVQVKVVFEITS